MNRLPMSAAASALLRAFLDRASLTRYRILLTPYRSVDWQSLTFIGERHEFGFRLVGPDAEALYAKLTDDLAEAEFVIPRQIVADIVVPSEPVRGADGSLSFDVEALTIRD